MTVVMLACLMALGTWQLHRRDWKNALLADINRGEAAPPVLLSADPAPFTKVYAEGVLRDDLDAFYGSQVRVTLTGQVLGAHLLTPLERPGALPVIVDRGWVPTGQLRPVEPASGPVRIEGYVRAPEHTPRFGPENDVAARRYFALDPHAIGAGLGLPAVAPFTLVALGEVPRGVVPIPAYEMPRPPNNHLLYAFTWFGIAGALLAVFTAYCRNVLRGEAPKTMRRP